MHVSSAAGVTSRTCTDSRANRATRRSASAVPAGRPIRNTPTAAAWWPIERTYGAAGSTGRFQVFAHVESTRRRRGLTLKTDVDEHAPSVASWVSVYPVADWHERECWEMFGIGFDGHPSLRHLYLPSEFEGHPLRKDFPLLARVVKPWPGLVDVEAMPDEGDAAPAVEAGEGESDGGGDAS